MEDAHISAAPFDKKVSVFGVFDGHGGKHYLNQGPKLLFSSRDIFLRSSNLIKGLRNKIMKKLSSKHFSKWMI